MKRASVALASVLAAIVATAALAAGYPEPSDSPPVPKALVSLASVSNGCGPGNASGETKWGDDSTFVNTKVPFAGEKKYRVDFREACKLHDAGYSGAEVADPIDGGFDDFFGWTRAQVDAKFLDDMRELCARAIPRSATVALQSCRWQGGYHATSGAYSRYLIVHAGGGLFFKERPNLRGHWSNPDAPTSPAWAIVQNGRTVKASWRGGAGHSGLRGSFEGVLVTHDQDSVVEGTMRVTEGTLNVTGTMTFTIADKQLDRFTLAYRQSNGVSGSNEMVRG